jgi:cytochrome c oxidase subunit 1
VILALLTFFIPDPPDVMWTGYPPYSTITTGNTAMYSFTVLILGFASIIGGVNFLTTVAYMRAPGPDAEQAQHLRLVHAGAPSSCS